MRTVKEFKYIETLFTRVAHKLELLKILGHVDSRVLTGAPASVLPVHCAREVRDVLVLRSRNYELELLFVQEQVEDKLCFGTAW